MELTDTFFQGEWQLHKGIISLDFEYNLITHLISIQYFGQLCWINDLP